MAGQRSILVTLKRAQFDAWVAAPTPAGATGGVLATLAVALGSQGDLCVNPALIVVTRTGEAPTRTESTVEWPRLRGSPVVGSALTRGWLQANRRTEPTAVLEQERIRYAYAHAEGLRELALAARQGDVIARGGGALPQILAAVVVVAAVYVVADCVRSVLNHRAELDDQRARDLAALQTAGAAYTERLRVFRETGTMPAASPVETAATALVQRYADRARGRDWSENVASAGRWIAYGAAALGLAYAFGGGKGES